MDDLNVCHTKQTSECKKKKSGKRTHTERTRKKVCALIENNIYHFEIARIFLCCTPLQKLIEREMKTNLFRLLFDFICEL